MQYVKSFELENSPNFTSVGKTFNKVNLYVDLTSVNVVVGQYNFTLKNISHSGELTLYKVEITVIDASPKKVAERPKTFWGSAFIQSISEKGLVTIVFNESMQVPRNLFIYNNETVEIYVEPSKSSKEDQTFNVSLINIT